MINNINTEKFVAIKGYEGRYKIGTNGTVISEARFIQRKLGMTWVSERILKQQTLNKGYLCVRIYKNDLYEIVTIHRLVAKHFIENKENYPVVNHKDGNKRNNHVSNLEWATPSQNQQHAYDKKLRVAPCNGPGKVPVSSFSKDGKWLNDFQSISDAAKAIGSSLASASCCVNGKLKSCKGIILKRK